MTPPRPPLVVVLGSSGPLGAAVVREFAARPVSVRAVSRRHTPCPGTDVEVRAADLTATGALAGAVAGADVVIHLVAHRRAGHDWRVSGEDRHAERVNTGLMLDLLAELRRRAGRGAAPVVLFAGSTSQAWGPAVAYDRHKLAAEEALLAATRDGVVRGVSLRMPTLYGPGSGHGVVDTMLRRALAGSPLPVWGDGAVLRDLVHVRDAAAAFAAALAEAGALAGGHWAVGSGEPVTVAELFGRIAWAVAEVTGRPPVSLTTVPLGPAAVETDLRDHRGSPHEFHRVTGWRARIPLAQGLRQTAAACLRRAPEELP
ncbi:NAD-dependent epimerase/dehydratase [Crossiella sp. SN42]|uniref:NAD-dependent epimerase/dehydratase family protein n=1 Tax=Crossiella sp. SN42 TaxID=2944808 RepID=UPI00207D6CC6|nr:NAD-dependent epimerase/dehydratase family protein [Crossiella sp. SN42]MCO1574618.1 NAD-dependent epimerase/dehydratase [Crossiella sp. SN42]